jgi:hypothetical protein
MPATDTLSEMYANVFSLSASNTTATLIFRSLPTNPPIERQVPADLVDWAKTICEHHLNFPGKFRVLVRYDATIVRQLFLEIQKILTQEENTGSP